MKKLWRAYLQTFKDIFSHSSIFTTLVLSVLLYSFFYPTAYKAQHAQSLPIVIVDEEQSPLTAQIIQQVRQSPNIEIKAITPDFSEAKHHLEQQYADGILLLPENLSQSLRHQETGGIGLYLSAANFLITKQIGLGLASSIEHSLAAYTQRFSQTTHFSPALPIHQIPLFNPLSGYGSYIFPAVAPLIIHQTILLGLSMLIAVYKERQIRLAPIEFVAMCLAVFSIGCLGCFYLFGFTFWLFDYPRGGNFWGLMLAVPIFVFAVIGLTCLFASFLDLPERAGHIIVFSSIPLFLLSGIAWPHAAMPMWIQVLATCLPSTHAIKMFIQLNQMGVSSDLIRPELLFLFIFGCICFAWGYVRLKKRMQIQ